MSRSVVSAFAEALAVISTADTTRRLAGTTLSSSISEAIAAIDSSTDDPVTGEDKESYTATAARMGKLQKLAATRALLLGDGEQVGLFATLKSQSDSLSG